MRRLAPLLVAGLLLLVGCASTPDEPDATLTEQAELPDGCLTVSPAALEALQGGLDEAGAGYTIDTAAAVQNDEGWYVAAHALGDPDVDAVWLTVNDPTVDADNAYVSVTELASLISYWAYPSDLTGADPVEAAKDCLP